MNKFPGTARGVIESAINGKLTELILKAKRSLLQLLMSVMTSSNHAGPIYISTKETLVVAVSSALIDVEIQDTVK